MSAPALAMSMAKRFCRERWRRRYMTSRSHRKRQRCSHRCGSSATVTWSVALCATSILAFTPLFFRASIRRLAATAAPPSFSLVFTISILIALCVCRYCREACPRLRVRQRIYLANLHKNCQKNKQFAIFSAWGLDVSEKRKTKSEKSNCPISSSKPALPSF